MMASRKWYDACVVVFTLSETTALPSFDACYQIPITLTLKRRISECRYCTVEDCSLKLVDGCEVRNIIVASEQAHNVFFIPRNATSSIVAGVQFGPTHTSTNTTPYYVNNSFFNQDSLQIQLLTGDGRPLRKDLVDHGVLNTVVLKFF